LRATFAEIFEAADSCDVPCHSLTAGK